MKQIGLLPKANLYIGKKVGENQKLVIDAIGCGTVTPLAMMLSPTDNNRDAKNELRYQALRQPVMGFIELLTALAITIPIGQQFHKVATKGYFNREQFNATRMLDHQKVMNFQALSKQIFPKDPVLYKQLTSLLNQSKEINEQERMLHRQTVQLTDLLESKYGDRSLKKSIGQFFDKTIKAEELIGLFPAEKTLLKKYIAKSNQVNQQVSTAKQRIHHGLHDILKSSSLTPMQTNQLEKIVKFNHSKHFQSYQLIFQWMIALIVFPIASISVNKLFPPFMKTMFPTLYHQVHDKHQHAVKNDNKIK